MARPTAGPRLTRAARIAVAASPGAGAPPVQGFYISFVSILVAEIGDRSQLLTLALAAQFRKPLPILAGTFVATIVNQTLAGLIGASFGYVLTRSMLDGIVGVSMIAVSLWALRSGSFAGEEGPKVSDRGAFLASLIGFFVIEFGDKTQFATLALAAAYPIAGVVAGSILGMMAANIPAAFLGDALSGKLPIRAMNYVAAVIFGAIGVFLLVRLFFHH